MRIQKLLLIVSVAGLSTFLAVAQSSDSEAQEKALKALREKMKELDNAKPATSAPVSKSPAPQKAAPPVATKKVEAPAPAPVVAGSGENEAQAKAIQALRKKEAELDAQQHGATATVAASPVAESQAAAQAAAAEALRLKQQELDAQNARQAKTQPPAVTVQSKSTTPVVASPAPMVRALPAAAVGLTADQLVGSSSLSRREKLDALLGLYLADTITPREYHQHRAAIVAQP